MPTNSELRESSPVVSVSTAKGLPGAISVLTLSFCASPAENPLDLFPAIASHYMEKIAVGQAVAESDARVQIDAPLEANLSIIAGQLRKRVRDLVVAVDKMRSSFRDVDGSMMNQLIGYAEPGTVLDLPLDTQIVKYHYYQTIHERSMVGGNPVRPRDRYADYPRGVPLIPLLRNPALLLDRPDPPDARRDAERIAAFFDVRHVVIHGEYLDPRAFALRPDAASIPSG